LTAVGAVVLGGALAGGAWVLERREQRARQAVVEATQELATLKELLARASSLRQDLADRTERVRSIQVLLHRRGTALQILDALLDSIPHGLWITTLEGRGRQLRALGAALSAGAVADLMSGLRASGRFDDVDIVVARQDLGEAFDTPLQFEITCRFGG
jgi:Tfp pilus assembly protein PilN